MANSLYWMGAEPRLAPDRSASAAPAIGARSDARA
jgi:hypothetical protein